MKTLTERTSARIARNAKPRERNVRRVLDERVKEYDGVTRAVIYLGRKGAPDVQVLFPSDSLFAQRFPGRQRNPLVETKKSDGKLSTHQKEEITLLRDAGADVAVVTTLEELDAWLPPL